MHRLGRFATLVAVLALVVAACGGGDDDADAGTGNGNGARTEAPSDNGGGGDDDNNNNNNNLGVNTTFLGNIAGLSDECTAIANLSIAFSQAFTGTFEDVPADIINSLPAEARAEGQILADALDEFASGLEEAGIDLNLLEGIGSLTPDQIQQYSEVSERVFNDEVEDAADRLGEAAEGCAPGAG